MQRYYLLLLLSSLVLKTIAVPAYRGVRTIIQTDGTQLNIVLHGDEHYHYTTTEDGYPIVQNANGIYEYALYNTSNTLVLTGVSAHNSDQRSIEETAHITTIDRQKNINALQTYSQQRRTARLKNIQRTQAYQPTRAIVLLVNFVDEVFTIDNPQEAFTRLLNEEGYSENGGTGSARDYFTAASNGAYTPTFDIYGPFDLPKGVWDYGENEKDTDRDPARMIADACRAADATVDFSQYDLNNDGKVDQVFVYYAGYNEAEGGEEYTIWPHRWSLTDAGIERTMVDGVRVDDYACTSEFRWFEGDVMCGIGTFCHEFGHVLGLPDLYNTNYTDDFCTLGMWDIMDGGSYNNNGCTPPTYSAYERFYMGWLTPTLLDTTQNDSLPELQSSNQARLITATGQHNLDGISPDPTSFYLMENRQQTGWDSYLPGHGLLLTKITYNAYTWKQNTVNDQLPMGVDIIEADDNAVVDPDEGFSGDSGDTYPNGSLYTQFDLYNKYSIRKITENNELIRFILTNHANTAINETTSNSYLVHNIADGLYISHLPEDAQISIYTLSGLALHSEKSTNGIYRNNLPAGAYIIQIQNKEGQIIGSQTVICH